MRKCEIKAIPAYLGIFTHIQAYSGIFRHVQTIRLIQKIIQAYSEPCVTLAYSVLQYIQNLGIFKTRGIFITLAYSVLWYIQNLSIFKTRGIFRTLLYPKLWHIQNQRNIQNSGLFRTLGQPELEAYSEPCQTSKMEHFEKQLTTSQLVSYNQFCNISFSCPLIHEINMIFFNVGLIFTPEFFIQCKKEWRLGSSSQEP